jgi:hypothetical protein
LKQGLQDVKLLAADAADVFGAMGSWNDMPRGPAHEKGLDEEYESLSDELLKQVRLATLYAINGRVGGQKTRVA